MYSQGTLPYYLNLRTQPKQRLVTNNLIDFNIFTHSVPRNSISVLIYSVLVLKQN